MEAIFSIPVGVHSAKTPLCARDLGEDVRPKGSPAWATPFCSQQGASNEELQEVQRELLPPTELLH